MGYKLSELREARHAEIDMHSDNGYNRHMAVEVKYYGRYPSQPANVEDAEWENIIQAAWERACETFWEDARDIAIDHGYTDVFSEGRMGGWLVPYFQSRRAGERYRGQGGDLGYPRYPDAESLADRAQFLVFQADILELLADAPRIFEEYALNMLETANEYPE